MPKFRKTGGLTLGELQRKVKNKEKLTPEEQKQVAALNKATSDIFSRLKDSRKYLVKSLPIPQSVLSEVATDGSWIREIAKTKAEEARIRKLTLKKLEEELRQREDLKELAYDASASVIIFAGKKIPIRKDTNQGALCRVLFQNKKSIRKEWSWDEVADAWGDRDQRKAGEINWRQVYEAAQEINKKVATKTAVEDLLLVTTKTVSINPKYLP